MGLMFVGVFGELAGLGDLFGLCVVFVVVIG